jgi:hypothetical protein
VELATKLANSTDIDQKTLRISPGPLIERSTVLDRRTQND